MRNAASSNNRNRSARTSTDRSIGSSSSSSHSTNSSVIGFKRPLPLHPVHHHTTTPHSAVKRVDDDYEYEEEDHHHDPSLSSSFSSSSFVNSYVWIRIGLAMTAAATAAAAESHKDPPHPHYHSNPNNNNYHHRSRSSEWDWCRARVISSQSTAAAPSAASSSSSGSQLDAPSSSSSSSSSSGSSSTRPRPPQQEEEAQYLTLTIDDAEFAPVELQHATICVRVPSAPPSRTKNHHHHQNRRREEEGRRDPYCDDPHDSTIITSNRNDTGVGVVAANAWWQWPTKKGSTDEEDSMRRRMDPDVLPPDDLTSLEQLHEPAIVFCLQQRYQQDCIYTYTGKKILLAINPFRSLPHLYTPAMMQHYYYYYDYDDNNSTAKNDSHSLRMGGLAAGDGMIPAIAATAVAHQHHHHTHHVNAHHHFPPPHIYAIARDAWTALQGTHTNQSILVSGESGSGKTVTTKICLSYLAERSQQQKRSNNNNDDLDHASINLAAGSIKSKKKYSTATLQEHYSSNKGGVEQQVLASNPILESFGNARTVRNDNSSRFGKLIVLHFSSSTGCLVSACMETYLLETVRLVTQGRGERNFHVFYEILAGVPQSQRRDWHIGNRGAHDFHMTTVASGANTRRRDGVEDRDSWKALVQALDTVGFSKDEQSDLFQVTCGLLHTSNLTFISGADRMPHEETMTLDRTNPSLAHVTQLLGIAPEVLNDALTKCRIEVRGEIMHKNLSATQALMATEALIKVTYGAVFEYIVNRINQSILNGHPIEDDDVSSSTAQIGILDIFGFESLETNSLEQLCINYCNEALQQQFNRFVFKLEQQEYQKEGIEWSFISFPDNQDVLDLIETKHEGILSILDEQCRLARCTDATFARNVYEKCQNHPRLIATAHQKAVNCFSISHYAGLVEYDTLNFVEKNKDELPKEAVILLQASSHPFLAQIGRRLSQTETSRTTTSILKSASPVKSTNGCKRPLHRASSSLLRDTVGIQFSSQLKALRVRIELTEPHYVRCLKPNDNLIAHSFNASVIADQLRSAGVLEAIRVSRAGFPHRYFHGHFVERYSLLARSSLNQAKIGSGRYEIGVVCSTLVEFLTPVLVRVLEAKSTEWSSPVKRFKGKEYVTEAKSNWPFHFAFLVCVSSLHLVYRIVFYGMQMGKTKVFLRRKAFEGLEHLRSMRLEGAATTIQSCLRMFLVRMDYDIAIFAVIIIQGFIRHVRAYRVLQKQRIYVAAVRIQCLWRLSQARASLRRAIWMCRFDASICLVQRVWRGIEARRYRTAAIVISTWCQNYYRGAHARQYCALLYLDRKVRIMQRAYKQHKTSKIFRKFRQSVITFQNLRRRQLAKGELNRLRLEARDLVKVASERDKYRNELVHLRKELEEMKRSSPENIKAERKAKTEEIRHLRGEVNRLRLELETARNVSDSRSTSTDMQFLVNELMQREDYLSQLKKEVDYLRSKDDSLSGSPFLFESSLSPGGRMIPTATPNNHDSGFGNHRNPGTPRSDVSLFDDDGVARYSALPLSLSYKELPSLEQPLKVLKRNLGFGVDSGFDTLQRLHEVIRSGNKQDFEELLRSSPEMCLVINQGDQYGRSALHIACMTLRIDLVNILISKGAVVNAQDNDGETPLHLAENAELTEVLLRKGKANPNIPNVDGICAIHLAVQRRDIDSVRHLLRNAADVNVADNIRWFTPLHLIALPARHDEDESSSGEGVRVRIAQMLCGSMGIVAPDLDYQDSQSNTPIHYASQLESGDMCRLLEVFLDNGSNPNIINERKQSPLHLLCHNGKIRRKGAFSEALRCMINNGANLNLQSLTGCTALHLCFYHRDIASAILLVSTGADLHLKWHKPDKWPSFWRDYGSSETSALDMVEDEGDLQRIISAIVQPSSWASPRTLCTSCRAPFGSFVRSTHCHHCRRFLCRSCISSRLPAHYFPKSFGIEDPSWVCGVCETILVSRKEEICSATPPTSSTYCDDVDFTPSRFSDQCSPFRQSVRMGQPSTTLLPESPFGFNPLTLSFEFDTLECPTSSFDDPDGRNDQLFAC